MYKDIFSLKGSPKNLLIKTNYIMYRIKEGRNQAVNQCFLKELVHSGRPQKQAVAIVLKSEAQNLEQKSLRRRELQKIKNASSSK